ncbi:MAG: hypothetical protein INH41_02375 [Myxococcaceae bacterium]|jgi:hypothetical protein|nr:hypothetical protein [Myxococcaceae bacterium]MCA3011225.1 hypothetical protein [Myxococcaceae bacterium]
MSLDWKPTSASEIQRGIDTYPLESGKCAALARLVDRVAESESRARQGVLVVPKSPARFLIHRSGARLGWYHHVFTEVQEHAVDALTGAAGHPRHSYLSAFFSFDSELEMSAVNVLSVDPDIEVSS